MSTTRGVAALVITAAVTVALGFASRAPYTQPGSDSAVLRLSWRLRGEKLETCRDRTQAELDALPVHMRTPQICTGHLISYRLIVRIDDAQADTLTFAPAGAKGDRPIFVLHDKQLAPGAHDVVIEFSPIEQVADHKQKPLRYAARVQARAGRIQLITLARDASALVLVE